MFGKYIYFGLSVKKYSVYGHPTVPAFTAPPPLILVFLSLSDRPCLNDLPLQGQPFRFSHQIADDPIETSPSGREIN